MLLRISSFFKAIFIVLSLLITTIFGGVALLIFKGDLGPRGYSLFARWCSKIILKVCLIRVDVQGLENVRHLKGVIYTPNHMSNFDILILAAFLPGQFRFVFKKELAKIPIFGWILKKSGNILVDRKNMGVSTLRSVKSEIVKGNSIVIFPGGTRSSTGYLNDEFKSGSFQMAYFLKIRIVPVTINGTFSIHNKVSPGIINSGRVEVIIHEPLNDFVGLEKKNKSERKELISEMSLKVKGIILSKFKTEI